MVQTTTGLNVFQNVRRIEMPSPLDHTKGCNHSFELHDTLVADYEQLYPNYCRTCQGWGGRWSKYDPSPSGVALSPGYMEEFDPCPDCLDKMKCPRCGGNVYHDEENYEVCPICLFKTEETDGLPQPPECYCHHIITEQKII